MFLIFFPPQFISPSFQVMESLCCRGGIQRASASAVSPALQRGFVGALCLLSFSLCPSSLHSVEPGAGVEYRIHSVPPRVYNPHHSTPAASTLSMHVLVNRCSFPVQTHTHTYTTRSYNASKKSDESSAAAAIAHIYVPASGVFFCFPLRADTAD